MAHSLIASSKSVYFTSSRPSHTFAIALLLSNLAHEVEYRQAARIHRPWPYPPHRPSGPRCPGSWQRWRKYGRAAARARDERYNGLNRTTGWRGSKRMRRRPARPCRRTGVEKTFCAPVYSVRGKQAEYSRKFVGSIELAKSVTRPKWSRIQRLQTCAIDVLCAQSIPSSLARKGSDLIQIMKVRVVKTLIVADRAVLAMTDTTAYCNAHIVVQLQK